MANDGKDELAQEDDRGVAGEEAEEERQRAALGYPKEDAFKEPGSRISREEFIRWERWGWDG